MNANLDKIVCPGCGWIGTPERFPDSYVCPECNYETDLLLTLATMIERDDIMYSDVDLPAFLRGVFLATGVIEEKGE